MMITFYPSCQKYSHFYLFLSQMDSIEVKSLEKAMKESIWEAKIQYIQNELKKDEARLQLINSIELEEKYPYTGENKNKYTTYKLVDRRLKEFLQS